MSEPDLSDPEACNRYRIVYGEAARLLEVSRFDHIWGRDFARDVPGRREQILADLARRYARYPAKLVELAVDDVLRGRRPRW